MQLSKNSKQDDMFGTFICNHCKNPFSKNPNFDKTVGKYCSRKCYFLSRAGTRPTHLFGQKGSAHPKWIDGMGGATRFTCVDCGKVLKNRYAERCQHCHLGHQGKSGLEERVEKIINKYQLPYKFVGDGKIRIERKCPDFVNTNGKKIAVELYWKIHKDHFRKGKTEGWMKDRIDTYSKYGWDTIFIEGSKMNEKLILSKLGGASL